MRRLHPPLKWPSPTLLEKFLEEVVRSSAHRDHVLGLLQLAGIHALGRFDLEVDTVARRVAFWDETAPDDDPLEMSFEDFRSEVDRQWRSLADSGGSG